VSLKFYIDIILLAALRSWDKLKTPNRNEYQEYFLGGEGDQCIGLIVMKCGGLNLLEPLGPVMGLL
jgi:hypothetical protein